jgi:NitT/TauT family transport system substrate-binding protein
MGDNRSIGLIIIFCILLTGGGVWYLQSLQQPPVIHVQDITIDPGKGAPSTLLLVAQDQGYFMKHGLNVTFLESPSATVAMQNLIEHKVDIGYVNEYSLSEPQLYNKKLRVIGTLSESDTNSVVGRRDRGVFQIPDLEGKKIGVTKGNIPEYFLDRFFVLNGLTMDNVTVVYLQPASLVNAIDSGDIDAAVSFEPYVYQMRRQLGGNAVVWPANLGQHAHYSLVCLETTLNEHPEIVQGVLASVIQAEAYVNSHPEEAKKIAMKQTNFDNQYMDQDWPNHRFSVGLSQSLITTMEDETRWRIRHNLTNVTDVPDFSKYLYADPLNRLKPSAVTFIR